ncbi:MAG: dihydroorotate dehydrogenase [Planctomycetes bacterium]|nr:dihydroorotate dehydrogenase [Planctomycetota bacterium]
MELKVKIGGRTLPGPVGVASGTFGYGSEYEQLTDFSAIGAIYTKAVTLEPRPGNDIPRIVETPAGILNSIGLANVGVKRFISEKMPYLATLPCAVIANVSGASEEDYLRVLGELEACERLFGYEINVSCPNVKQGCMAFGTDPAMVEKLTTSLRRETTRPLILKLSPNVTDIATIAKAAEAGGADAISCINTLVGMVIDTRTGRPVLPAGTGGLSGPAIRPVGVAMTRKGRRAVSLPVIGMGGIMNLDDALQYLLAGASAVQVGTGIFVDPSIPARIHEGLLAWCQERAISDPGKIHTHFHPGS